MSHPQVRVLIVEKPDPGVYLQSTLHKKCPTSTKPPAWQTEIPVCDKKHWGQRDRDNTTYPYMASIQDAGLTARDGSAHEKTELLKPSLNGAPGPIAGLDAPCEAGQGH